MLSETARPDFSGKSRHAGKTLIQILFLSVLLPSIVFPQDRMHKGVLPEKLTTEKLWEIQKSSVDDLPGLNDRESSLLKSEYSDWETALRNQQREFYEEGFDTKDSRTKIYKTLLDNGFLLIECIYQTWDGSYWVNNDKASYTYDVNNNLIEELLQTWNGYTWGNFSKYSYTYDVNNNLIELLRQNWDGFTWANSSKDSYTYDGNNNLIEELWQEWEDSNWVNYYKLSYTYDVNNNLIEELWQYWDGTNWVNYLKYSNTYDGNNNLIERLWQDWDGTTWVNEYKYSYIYDGNNNLIEELQQTWYGSIWVNFIKFSYTYDVNNNLIEELWKSWDGYGSTWVNYLKYSNTYDVNNNLIEHLQQSWDGTNWVNYYKYSYTYDGNNNLIEELQQTWYGSNWLNDYKYTYSYIPTGIEQFEGEVSTYILSNNYPNPFNPSTKISWQVPVGSWQTLKVYDVLGNEVATLVDEFKSAGNYEIEWSAGEFPSGVYFYQLLVSDLQSKDGKTENYIETKKMLLLK